MQIAKHKVATIEYTLIDEQGAVLDSSKGGDALAYIQGIGNLMPGLEAALEGRSAGNAFTVTLPPEQGYGVRDEDLVQGVDRDLFGEVADLQAGMQFEAQRDSEPMVVTVLSIEEANVTVDGNHPLAGVTLNFDVDVVEVRDATDEELDHGHVHGPEGHSH